MWRLRAARSLAALGGLVAGLVMCQLPVLAGDIATTKHNLSASGPGTTKSSATSEICVFCHAPHNSITSRALWNQAMSPHTYTPYTSSTLYSQPGQPTGSSRLCLSCHDGTTALGSLRAPPSTGPVTLAPLEGIANLGTDLSDDHPISFVYDAALAQQRGTLFDPATLPPTVPLDASGQMQCTTCHDPHKDTGGQFLRVVGVPENCNSCHMVHGDERNWHYTCSWCHDMHGAAGRERLLIQPDVITLCSTCHLYPAYNTMFSPQRSVGSATVSATVSAGTSASGGTSSLTGAAAPHAATNNLSADFGKTSIHPVWSFRGEHQPEEDPMTMPRHVTCTDCHEAHQSGGSSSSPSLTPDRHRVVRGIDLSGVPVTEARYEYERCFKCHGLKDQATPGIVRQDNTRNVRLEIDPGNASYHPVAAVGKNPGIQGLQPGYSAASLLTCVDCHNSDDWTEGGVAPKGPHGSRYAPILERQYEQGDPVPNASQSYALCDKCHASSAVLSRGSFPHVAHVQEHQASCAVCHDAHGSRNSVRLINFMLRDQTGKTVVSPNRRGLLQFLSASPGHGECSLSCHGAEHDRRSY